MVEVAAAKPSERGVLDNLFQLYVHDFSEQWAGGPRGELGADGRFEPYPWLDSYWSEPGRVPLLLRRGGFLIGFALLNQQAHSGEAVDWNMAEFFIVRKHRRCGAGAEAAQAIFREFPGQWEAAVARRNTTALAFWRKTIARCPGVSAIEELDRDDAAWNGPILRFRVG